MRRGPVAPQRGARRAGGEPRGYLYLPDYVSAAERADVLAWLATRGSEQFDVAIVDPPTFSNSKKMTQEFDVLRDHPTILRQVFTRMRPGGVVWFSTNHRHFQLLPALAEEFAVVEMTAKTIPPDFAHSKPHKSYRLTRR